MLFSSAEFVVFFVVVFFVYHLILKERTKAQNVFLLVASYFFYGYADWRMLPLLVIATVVFYGLGIAIGDAKTEKADAILSTVGITLGVGLLVYFKYLNFFIESFAQLFESMGLKTNIHTFRIVMPLGISFFTFRLISYVVEVHRGTTEPTRDLVSFATYIAFFPCILSGPIDRPDFMEQLQRKRVFDYDKVVDGLRQILWGMFKKMVIADNCAQYVDNIWTNYTAQNGSTLILAAILYSIQLYADFSGYSDMAIGIGKLLGFRIADNFKYPYFATNVAEFWRRWHISLTSWVTDYVFMPLNMMFRNMGKFGVILAILINMLIVGMWHEANWTCVVYGLYHGLLFVPLILSGSFNRKTKLQTTRLGLPKIGDLGKMVLTFTLVTISFVIFRADNIQQAWEYSCSVVRNDMLTIPLLINRNFYAPLFSCIVILFVVEWIQREKEHALDLSIVKSQVAKFSIYIVLIGLVFWLGGHAETFIYFQF